VRGEGSELQNFGLETETERAGKKERKKTRDVGNMVTSMSKVTKSRQVWLRERSERGEGGREREDGKVEVICRHVHTWKSPPLSVIMSEECVLLKNVFF